MSSRPKRRETHEWFTELVWAPHRRLSVFTWHHGWTWNVHRCEVCALRLNLGRVALVLWRVR